MPGVVVDERLRTLAPDGGEPGVLVHGGGVVAPDDEFLDARNRLPGARGELRQGPVAIEPHHGREARLGQARGRFHRDVGIGIRGIALRLLVGNLEKLEHDRLVGAEHRARSDAKQQAVADLAGGAGHGDANGGLHCERLLVEKLCRGGAAVRSRRRPVRAVCRNAARPSIQGNERETAR